MDPAPPSIPASMTIAELSDRIAGGDAPLSRHQAISIVDAQGALAGIITRGDIVRSLRQDGAENVRVIEAGGTDLLVAFPEEPLHDALTRMLNHDIGRLPVVSQKEPRRLVGYLGRAEVLSARKRLHDEEHLHPQGWSPPVPSPLIP